MNSFKMTLAAAAVAMGGCTAESSVNLPTREMGPETQVGDARVGTYAEFDATGAPVAIGVRFSEVALETFPTEMGDKHHCFDKNGDGQMQHDTECMATHERVIPLPTLAARRPDMPFKWVLFNWNPMGHMPPGIYDLPHFDVHFYMEPIENIMAIETGPCGPEFVRCDQFETARKPLPPNFMPPDYQNFDAVAPAMGNHLLDVTSSELHGDRFKRTYIYGTYDGRMIFQEEMITNEFLASRPDTCFTVKQPAAFAQAGYYPSQSCARYNASDSTYSVSLEGFGYSEATVPLPIETAGM